MKNATLPGFTAEVCLNTGSHSFLMTTKFNNSGKFVVPQLPAEVKCLFEYAGCRFDCLGKHGPSLNGRDDPLLYHACTDSCYAGHGLCKSFGPLS